MRLLLNPWKETFSRRVSEAKESIVLVSPFMKFNIISSIYRETANTNVQVRTVTRCKVADFCAGASDIDCLYALGGMDGSSDNLQLRIDNNLHAKIFIFDGRIAYVGSSNLTFSGLQRNYEAVIEISDEEAVRHIAEECASYWLRAKPVVQSDLIETVRKVRNLSREARTQRDREEHLYSLSDQAAIVVEPPVEQATFSIKVRDEAFSFDGAAFETAPRITSAVDRDSKDADLMVSDFINTISNKFGVDFTHASHEFAVAAIFANAGSYAAFRKTSPMPNDGVPITPQQFASMSSLGHYVWNLAASIIAVRSGVLRQFGRTGAAEFVSAVGQRRLLDILWEQNMLGMPVSVGAASASRGVVTTAAYQLFAAITLEAGLAKAIDVIEDFFNPTDLIGDDVVDIIDLKHEKTLLQEVAQARGRKVEYTDYVRSGTDHEPCWSCSLKVGGMATIEAQGRNKTDAENTAARQALKLISVDPKWSAILAEIRHEANLALVRGGPYTLLPAELIEVPWARNAGDIVRAASGIGFDDSAVVSCLVDKTARAVLGTQFDNEPLAFLGSAVVNATIALRAFEHGWDIASTIRTALKRLPTVTGTSDSARFAPGIDNRKDRRALEAAQALAALIVVQVGGDTAFGTINLLAARSMEEGVTREVANSGLSVLDEVSSAPRAGVSYAEALQRLTQHFGKELPEYRYVRSGPDHDPKFKAILNWRAYTASATAGTKRDARDKAAFAFLTLLKETHAQGKLVGIDGN